MNTITALQQLGLSIGEARVYVGLRSLKTGSVLSVARVAGVKRPTCYYLLRSLEKKHLVASTRFRGVTDYRSTSTEHLRSFVRAQQKALSQTLPEMLRLYSQKTKKMQIRKFHGIPGIKTLFEKVLREQKNLRWIGDDQTMEGTLGDYWGFFRKRSAQRGIHIEWNYRAGPVAILLWSDKVGLVILGSSAEAIVIKDRLLSDTYSTLWKTSSRRLT